MGPRFYQKYDILRTIRAFKKIGVNIKSWRTHQYASDATTYSLLNDFNFAVVSDNKSDKFSLRKEIGGLYHLSITGPTDGLIRPFSENKEYKRELWRFIRKQTKEGRNMVLQLHPICQKILDNFETLKKVTAGLKSKGYKFCRVSEVIKKITLKN